MDLLIGSGDDNGKAPFPLELQEELQESFVRFNGRGFDIIYDSL